MRRFALYLHIPFCKSRCNYCDFNTFAGLESCQGSYVQALLSEIVLQGERFAALVETIYFGGGTPSLLPTTDLADALAACQRAFACEPDLEVSLEANPETIDAASLSRLRRTGFNRLSLGFQSVHTDELTLLGRTHSYEQAAAALGLAREAGFDNLSVDLIYGLPGQSVSSWARSLDAVLTLDPEHISAYGLKVEKGTRLATQIALGHLPEPDPDLAADMYEWAETVLAQAGLEHYEISNWAKPGYQCRHNLVYWRGGDYVGLGAGAHSFVDACRWSNVLDPRDYSQRIAQGQSVVAGMEKLTLEQRMAEMMILGLRLVKGVGFAEFERRFGIALPLVYAAALDELERFGLIARDADRVYLTARGRLLGNQVFCRFV